MTVVGVGGVRFSERRDRRRCAAEWKRTRYSNQKLKDRLGWKPRVPMEKALEKFLAQFESNGNSEASKR